MLNPRFVTVGSGSSSMMDSELKRTSVRANKLEKKRFEMMLTAYDSAKRNVALEMKKCQVDVKRRLKKYKDRQREILVTKSESSASAIDDYLVKEVRRRSETLVSRQQRQSLGSSLLPSPHPHPHPHQHTHPHGNPVVTFNNRDQGEFQRENTGTSEPDATDTPAAATATTTTTAASSSLGSTILPPPQEEQEFIALSHRRKSKADLRPYIAWSMMRNPNRPDPSKKTTTTTTTTVARSTTGQSTVKLLQLKGGSLGTHSRQVRYLDDDEIEKRCSFHRFLLDKYRHLEYQRLERINTLVGEFCGKSDSNRLTASCPPIMEVAVVSLPVGVPASVHRAMRVRAPSMVASAAQETTGKSGSAVRLKGK